VKKEIARLEKTAIGPSSSVNELLEAVGTAPIKSGVFLAELIRRPQLNYEMLKPYDPERKELPKNVIKTVEINIKYDGYIKHQLAQVEKFAKLEDKTIPEDIDYSMITGIRAETKQKLTKFRPANIGQASRISGVSPADISVLMLYLGIQ